jgi:preprotein translocase subunit SecE
VLPNSPTFTTLLDWAGIAYGTSQKAVCLGVSSLLLAAGAWFSYRIVNYPRFADFLVAVEAEMNKVSWPSRAELFRSSLVVILVIFALAAVLFGYDLVWKFFFGKLGVLQL